MGGLAPNFSILGHQQELFGGFGFVQGSETGLNFSHGGLFYFITCQTCEPFVAQDFQNWMVAQLVVVLDSSSKGSRFHSW